MTGAMPMGALQLKLRQRFFTLPRVLPGNKDPPVSDQGVEVTREGRHDATRQEVQQLKEVDDRVRMQTKRETTTRNIRKLSKIT